MNEEMEKTLRAPFPAEQIGKLPKLACSDCTNAVKNRQGKSCGKHKAINCKVCGNWISEKHVHLDYVGHAETTDRLLKADPHWTWEPMGVDGNGLPALDGNGGLWIKLTVGAVTRPGYGDAGTKRGPDAIKEAIGDAIRNAAMRFGVALDLWAKTDLDAPASSEEEVPHTSEPKPQSGAGGQAKRDSAEPKPTSSAGESMQSFMLRELKGPQRPAFLSWMNENLPDVTITCVPFAMQKTVEDAINKFACGEVPPSLGEPF